MAYTFQQAGTDNISFTLPVATWGSDAIGLVTGWYWITTLADNATYWHAGTDANILRMVSATKVSVIYDAGTNGHYDFDNALSSGEWVFIATLLRVSSSTLDYSAIWVGDVNNPPQEQVDDGSPYQGVAPAVTGTVGRVGGNGGGSNGYSFSGDAADVSFFVSRTNSTANLFGQAPSQAFDNEGKTRILNEFVMPIWRGDYASALHPDKRRTAVTGTGEQDGFLVHLPLRNNTQVVGRVGTTLNGQATNSGATVSTTRTSPRQSPMDLYPPHATRISGRRMG